MCQRLFQIACIEVHDLAERVHVCLSNAGTHAGRLGFRAEFLTENVPLQPTAEVVLDNVLHDVKPHRSRLDHLKLIRVAVVSHRLRKEHNISTIGHLLACGLLRGSEGFRVAHWVGPDFNASR